MINQLYAPFKKWDGTVWIYADTHFGNGFETIYKDTWHWPTDELHVALINKFVGKKDTLIILGDVGDLEVAKGLKGYKVLVLGNHDKGRTTYEDIFDEVYDGPLFVSKKILLSHEPVKCLPYAFNIHGHDHYSRDYGGSSINVCANVVGYKPLNLNKFIKKGGTSKVHDIHEFTIRERM